MSCRWHSKLSDLLEQKNVHRNLSPPQLVEAAFAKAKAN